MNDKPRDPTDEPEPVFDTAAKDALATLHVSSPSPQQTPMLQAPWSTHSTSVPIRSVTSA